jgi:hypothetical protein
MKLNKDFSWWIVFLDFRNYNSWVIIFTTGTVDFSNAWCLARDSKIAGSCSITSKAIKFTIKAIVKDCKGYKLYPRDSLMECAPVFECDHRVSFVHLEFSLACSCAANNLWRYPHQVVRGCSTSCAVTVVCDGGCCSFLGTCRRLISGALRNARRRKITKGPAAAWISNYYLSQSCCASSMSGVMLQFHCLNDTSHCRDANKIVVISFSWHCTSRLVADMFWSDAIHSW